MTLTSDEREDLDIALTLLIASFGDDEAARDAIPMLDRSVREFAVGFLSGFLYHRRRGHDVGSQELKEIRRLVYDRSSELRRAVEQATTA
jgi:hypothetical protein